MDAKSVFVNCPFDKKYKSLFDAIVFTIHDLGFQARHALIDNSNAVRLVRIAKEIAASKYSIHDISRVESSGSLKLPRFNMPFEAGIAYSLHEESRGVEQHHLLLLDSEPYRYHASLSDAAGMDAKIHYGDPARAIGAVRAFLVTKSREKGVTYPGEGFIRKRYALFQTLLRSAARDQHLSIPELKSWDYVNDLQAMMQGWIAANPP